MTVACLFVDDSEHGIYPKLVGDVFCFGEHRRNDARLYEGPHPVVAHPPCNLWVNMAAQNYARATRPCDCLGLEACDECQGTGRREPNRAVVLPAWYPGGTDEGRFAAALAAVRKYGGVLEHPAGSHAWKRHALVRPGPAGWYQFAHPLSLVCSPSYYVCEVWQSAYGHLARKRTWLLYCGERPPFELNWAREPGTHQVGWFDRNKPTLAKRAASATPEAFARELIRLADWSRGED